jgi:hypothetical protein
MRSETTPIWITFIWALGFFLLLSAGIALVTGKAKLSRHKTLTRAENPEAFWGLVGAYAGLGAIAFGYGVLHFGPGG